MDIRNTLTPPTNQMPQTISLRDVLVSSHDDTDLTELKSLKITEDPVYVTFFTYDAVPVAMHYLEATDTWSGGYYRCPGPDCPACKLGIPLTHSHLLPVVDRLDGGIKVLRIPSQKGPGKLLTELGLVLTDPHMDKMIVTVTRRGYTYRVNVQRHESVDPEVAIAAQRFVDAVNAGGVNVLDTVPAISIEDMKTHERIARRLSLVGGAAE